MKGPLDMLERYVQWMLTEGGAPSRYAVYMQLIVGIGLVAALCVLLPTLWSNR